MNTYEACRILGIAQESDFDSIKLAYRRACSKFHPDRNPGGHLMMQQVNIAYSALCEHFENNESVKPGADDDGSYSDALMAAINAVCSLPGVIVEVIGSWVWLSGNTKENKDHIKAFSTEDNNRFRWSQTKMLWYFRPQEFRSFNRKKTEIDEIREKYGSKKVTPKHLTPIK